MSELLVNAEGGLTTAGYAVTIIAGVILFLAAVFFCGKDVFRKADEYEAACVLCRRPCTGISHILY